MERYDELTKDYVSVLDIDKTKLPGVEDFSSGNEFANALRHEPNSKKYNPHFRQLLDCSYKIAGEKGKVFSELLNKHLSIIEKNVTENLYKRHLKPLFSTN